MVNNGSLSTVGLFFRLDANIDLANYEWTPIGTDSRRFYAVFNGAGYTVSNLRVKATANYAGLFGVIDSGTVSGLTITNVNITTGYGYAGSLCGDLRGTTLVQHCLINGSIFVGYGDTTQILSSNICIGGVFGRVRDTATVYDCKLKVTDTTKKMIYGYAQIGGFAGNLTASGLKKFNSCIVDNITVAARSNAQDRVGGFYGEMSSDAVNCSFESCSVLNSNVSGRYAIGGFGFSLRGNASVYGCCVANTNIVDNGMNSTSFDHEVGGMFGYVSSSSVQIKLCYSYIRSMTMPKGNDYDFVGAFVGKNAGGTSIYYTSTPRSNISSGNYYKNFTVSDTLIAAEGSANASASVAASAVTSIESVDVINNGNLGWRLNGNANSLSEETGVNYRYYYTQKDGDFASGVPVPGNAGNAISQIAFWCEDVNKPEGYPNLKHFSSLYFLQKNVSGAFYNIMRVSLYINAGQTGAFTDVVPDQGWEFKIHVTGTDYDKLYATNDYTSFALPTDAYRISYSVKMELYPIEYTITYKLGTTTINPAGAPTTFNVRTWPSLSGVACEREYWRFGGWNTEADGSGTALTQIQPSVVGYNNVTIYADMLLEQETGADGKVYNLIYTFEHLEKFRELYSRNSAINGKLSPIMISYPKITLTKPTVGEPVITCTQANISSFASRPESDLTRIDEYIASLPRVNQALARRNIESMKSEYLEYAYSWNPGTTTYCGIFDGNGAAISGVEFGGAVIATNKEFGLFCGLGNGALVKNLTLGGTITLTSTDTVSSVKAGSVCAKMTSHNARIIDCTSSVSIDATGLASGSSVYCGGFVGGDGTSTEGSGFYADLERCSSTGTINIGAATGYAGGIVGSAYSAMNKIENCRSGCTIISSNRTGDVYAAGLAGYFRGIMKNCYFYGALNRADVRNALISNESNVNITMTKCYYIDTVTATQGLSVAMTDAQMKSGELCWLLQEGQADPSVRVWGQSSLTTYPVLTSLESSAVRKVCRGNTPYYNLNAVKGDADNDYKVDTNDLTRFLNASVGLGYAEGGLSDLAVGDLSGDGVIDAIDAAMLELAISGGGDNVLS